MICLNVVLVNSSFLNCFVFVLCIVFFLSWSNISLTLTDYWTLFPISTHDGP